MKSLFIALLVAVVVVLVSLIYTRVPGLPEQDSNKSRTTVQIREQIIRVTVADTEEEREKGLSGRLGLAPDEGMLFEFPEDGKYAFWMKDMKFPIDIVWISYSGEIVDIWQELGPETFPTVYTPRGEARYVLELPAGYVLKYNVRLGDIVRL